MMHGARDLHVAVQRAHLVKCLDRGAQTAVHLRYDDIVPDKQLTTIHLF